MSTFPWKANTLNKKSQKMITDIGDIRLILKEHNDHWTLDMGIRVYCKDNSKSMIRPPVTVEYFDKPCTREEAMELTEAYFNHFLSTITSTFE